MKNSYTTQLMAVPGAAIDMRAVMPLKKPRHPNEGENKRVGMTMDVCVCVNTRYSFRILADVDMTDSHS